MLDDGLDLLVEDLREVYLALQDVLVNDHRILISKWIDSCVHFVDENAQSPPIHALSMPLIEQDLRREVLRSAAERIGPCFDDLSKAEIC